jgi:hypothetical protein
MVYISILVAYTLVLSLGGPLAKEWRGLSPLKSTRTDVERLLGPPDDNFEDRLLTYYLTDEVVSISFAANPDCRQTLTTDSWNVSAETVTGIRITLRHQVPVNEAGIDLTKLEKRRGDNDVAEHFYYSNADEGFSVEVGQNYLMGYVYGPRSKQRKLLCPAR